jgi:hypothetical protein
MRTALQPVGTKPQQQLPDGRSAAPSMAGVISPSSQLKAAPPR